MESRLWDIMNCVDKWLRLILISSRGRRIWWELFCYFTEELMV